MKEQIKKWLDSNYKNFLKKNPTKALTQSELDHIVDWMSSSQAESYLARLDRVSVLTALDLANKWTQRMNKLNSRKLDIESSLKGVEIVHKFEDGFFIAKLKTEEAFKAEGVKMGHCVASYYSEYSRGQSDFEIYSLRDSSNQPHCTIEFTISDRFIAQIKGKANEPVVKKYHKYIVEFLNNFDFDNIYSYDLQNISSIYFGNYVFLSDELPSNLVVQKNLTIEKTNFIHTFDCLEVQGDLCFSKNRRCKKIAKKLIVKGDIIIEEFHGLLKLADEIVCSGSIEIEDCENLRLLGDKVTCEGAFVASSPNFKVSKGFSFDIEVD